MLVLWQWGARSGQGLPLSWFSPSDLSGLFSSSEGGAVAQADEGREPAAALSCPDCLRGPCTSMPILSGAWWQAACLQGQFQYSPTHAFGEEMPPGAGTGDAGTAAPLLLSPEMREQRMEDKISSGAAPHRRLGTPAATLPAPAPAPATMAAGLPLAIWTAGLFLWQHFSRNTSEGAWCCAKTREAASPTMSPVKGSEKRPRHLSCLPPHLLPSLPPW